MEKNKRICPKCGNKVPKFYIKDRKKHNCQHRKYCFECSPFGKHNTKRLEVVNGEVVDKNAYWIKYFHRRQKRVIEKIQSIVGSSCWVCGYDRLWRNLCFHHIDPSKKLFTLSTRELMLKWDRVFQEMQKCILVCHNCHGEIHAGSVNSDFVDELYKEKWISLQT